MKSDPGRIRFGKFTFFMLVLAAIVLLAACATNAATAEEYYDMGMAYFELGKYDEAEYWLNRAKNSDRTMAASEYNLGRIAYAAGRYKEAAEHFERILVRESDNVMALKGAAYSRIKNGDLDLARAHYAKVLLLVPESADDGYNYALVLYAMEDYSLCEDTLKKYEHSLETDNDALLLYARAQAAQGKPEAADSYDKWIEKSRAPYPLVNYEYGKVLVSLELYAKALEQFRDGLRLSANDRVFPRERDFRFEIGSLLLVADPGNEEGISEIKLAIENGFDDAQALERLLNDSRITEADRDNIRRLYSSETLL